MKFKYIEKNPEICGGKPVFKGTRIPVYIVLDLLSAGESVENILKNYPLLKKEAVLEAIKFASEYTKMKEELIEISD
ncbi:DUF433 domain-containing protein [Persephonella atlantica]|uniref:DUF433 domain-containing protein n=1 Tax=Persephonella atlantica TaxID=2699429 RepID=A0ABS1GJ35_9AQUI|nr:DUF433 domain-containing protein [Persephonella atlantica]MBK3332942.1 DUF433 domain-containing protein [Persephonella atlantica]